MSKLLYLEGASGICGDMTVAALLDLGGSREKLDAVLNSLRLEGFDYAVSRKCSCGVEGCDFDVFCTIITITTMTMSMSMTMSMTTGTTT